MTMTIAPIAPLTAPPAPEAHEPQRQPGAHAFAELLRQNRTPEAAPKPAAPPASTNDAEGAQAANPSPAPAGRNRTPATNAAAASPRAAAREPGAKADSDGADAKPVAAHEPADTDNPGAEDAAPHATPEPALAQWLAELQPPASATAALQLARRDAGDAASAQFDVEAAASTGAAPGRGPNAKASDTAQGVDAGKRSANPRDEPGRDMPDAAGKLRERLGALGAVPGRGADAAPASRTGAMADLSSLSAAALNLPQGPVAAAVVPADVRIDTPFARPEFAQAFGVQVSMLARDGIHRAELHLNPADMGPVSVQIVVDGTQARVDFGADNSATRQAIEAGLPELASALRDAGLTLSGGGVSQHSRGGGAAGGDDGQRRASPGPGAKLEAEPSSPQAQRTTVAGGIDLYA